MINMLAFSKQREPQLESLLVQKIVADVIELVQEQADEAGIAVLTDLDESAPPIPVDYDGLHQAVLNLISNAIDAVPRGAGNHQCSNVARSGRAARHHLGSRQRRGRAGGRARTDLRAIPLDEGTGRNGTGPRRRPQERARAWRQHRAARRRGRRRRVPDPPAYRGSTPGRTGRYQAAAQTLKPTPETTRAGTVIVIPTATDRSRGGIWLHPQNTPNAEARSLGRPARGGLGGMTAATTDSVTHTDPTAHHDGGLSGRSHGVYCAFASGCDARRREALHADAGLSPRQERPS